MRVYARARHRYIHLGRLYEWVAGQEQDVPDAVAEAVCRQHPEKLLRLGGASSYKMVASAPVDRQMKANISANVI